MNTNSGDYFYVRCPFTILFDTAEKTPFSFTDLRAMSFVDKKMRTYLPQIKRQYLGIGRGDYTIEEYESKISLERKSLKDFCGTLLGWKRTPEGKWDTAGAVDRRRRFKRELAFLDSLSGNGHIIVEATEREILENAPSYGKRSSGENAKYIQQTTIAWACEFPCVRWWFLDDRRLAEIRAFRILEQWWAREQRHARARK